MADSAALYGLIGAVSGALLGAGAAVMAPFLQIRAAERARRHSRAEAEMGRLLDLRKSTRMAVAHLSETVEALIAGRPPTIEEFVAARQVALNAVEEAAESATMDGLEFALSPGSGQELVQRAVLRRQPAPPSGAAAICDHTQRGRQRSRQCAGGYNGGEPQSLSPEAAEELRWTVTRLEELRGELLSRLLDRMESLREVQGSTRM